MLLMMSHAHPLLHFDFGLVVDNDVYVCVFLSCLTGVKSGVTIHLVVRSSNKVTSSSWLCHVSSLHLLPLFSSLPLTFTVLWCKRHWQPIHCHKWSLTLTFPGQQTFYIGSKRETQYPPE